MFSSYSTISTLSPYGLYCYDHLAVTTQHERSPYKQANRETFRRFHRQQTYTGLRVRRFRGWTSAKILDANNTAVGLSDTTRVKYRIGGFAGWNAVKIKRNPPLPALVLCVCGRPNEKPNFPIIPRFSGRKTLNLLQYQRTRKNVEMTFNNQELTGKEQNTVYML